MLPIWHNVRTEGLPPLTKKMTKTNWSSQSKQKDNWSSPSKNKTAFSESTKNKTAFNEASKQKTDFTHPGDGSYSFEETIDFDDPDMDFDEGECLFDGPLRITTYSAGKKKTGWS